jgi:membrane protein implicated in regulation of membrane protease activity
VNRWILIGVGAFVGLLVILFGREVRKSRHDEGYVSPTSDAALQGSFGQVASRLDPSGEVVVSGEVWEAELLAGGIANVGERVRVVQRRDNCLLVERQPYALEPGQPGEIV